MTNENTEEIPGRCLGETGPLSLRLPTEHELAMTKELEATLAQMKLFETKEEMYKRQNALVRLQDLANIWVRQKCRQQRLPAHIINSTMAKIYTFGSYRLGVNFRGADIDSLLVVPRFITREEFFAEFHAQLLKNPHVDDLRAVPHAFVPVLKLKFMNVEIDLLFARVDLMTIPSDFSLCDNTETLMRNMDEYDIRSINGVRVTEDVLDLVHRKDNLKTALKVIRLWAKRRNIYSNAMGFFGGVSWALLMARICQLYPKAAPSFLVLAFFRIFTQWPWPKPVLLRTFEDIPSLGLPVWDPRVNPMDQYHLMPIITPSFPYQNSTYNVQRSNRMVIAAELRRGAAVVEDVFLRKCTWDCLFQESYFYAYRHYVVVVVIGQRKDAFAEKTGLVESRLRVLVSNIESNRHIKLAQINCQSFGKGPNDDEYEFVRKWLIGIEFEKGSTNTPTTYLSTSSDEKTQRNIDLSESIRLFEKTVTCGKATDEVTDIYITYAKRDKLDMYLSEDDMNDITAKATAAANDPYPIVGLVNTKSPSKSSNKSGKAVKRSSTNPKANSKVSSSNAGHKRPSENGLPHSPVNGTGQEVVKTVTKSPSDRSDEEATKDVSLSPPTNGVTEGLDGGSCPGPSNSRSSSIVAVKRLKLATSAPGASGVDN